MSPPNPSTRLLGINERIPKLGNALFLAKTFSIELCSANAPRSASPIVEIFPRGNRPAKLTRLTMLHP